MSGYGSISSLLKRSGDGGPLPLKAERFVFKRVSWRVSWDSKDFVDGSSRGSGSVLKFRVDEEEFDERRREGCCCLKVNGDEVILMDEVEVVRRYATFWKVEAVESKRMDERLTTFKIDLEIMID